MAGGLLAGLATLLAGCGGEAAQPSVLIVVAQGVRADHLSVYGYDRQTSPALESLAGEGARFDRAYSSTPDPASSFASLLTGRYPPEHNLQLADVLDSSILPLPAHLAALGYETHLITSDPGPAAGSGLFESFAAVEKVDPSDVPELDGGAAAVTARALEWLGRGRDRARPFFLVLVYSSPTLPFDPPEPYRSRFAQPWMTAETLDRGSGVWLPLARRVNSGELALGTNDVEVLTVLYDAELAYLDDRIAALLAGMSDEGSLDNTAILFTSDRGELLGQAGRLADTISLHESNLRVPLIIRPQAGAGDGARTESFAQDVDLYPTICQLLGVPRPASVSPQAFALLAPAGSPRRVAAVSVALQPVGPRLLALTMSLRNSRYRYLLSPQGPLSLFDYEQEDSPREILREAPELAGTLKGQLAAWDLQLARPPGAPPAERFPEEAAAPAAGSQGGGEAGAGKTR